MKFRFLSVLGTVCVLSVGAFAADNAAPSPSLTTTITAKKSAITVGSGSIALVKGTKLVVVSREGDFLLVKFHAAQGKVPLADTDFNPDTALPEISPPPLPTVAPRTAGQTPGCQQAATVQAPAAATPAAKTPPPALSLDQKPASNYGKMVQKAKQVEQVHNDKLVKPTDEILDDTPKK